MKSAKIHLCIPEDGPVELVSEPVDGHTAGVAHEPQLIGRTVTSLVGEQPTIVVRPVQAVLVPTQVCNQRR